MDGLPPIVDLRQSATALRVQRGVMRLLRQAHDFCCYAEVPLRNGRRADVLGVGPGGEVWIVEIKSSVEDLRADRKWPDYRRHCDRLFFATHPGVPTDLFPPATGLILADGFNAEIVREAPEHRMPPATRRALTLRFAHVAARRFQHLADPGLAAL